MRSRSQTLLITAVILLGVISITGFTKYGKKRQETYAVIKSRLMDSDMAQSLKESIASLEKRVGRLTGYLSRDNDSAQHAMAKREGITTEMEVTVLPDTRKYPRVCCFVITDPPILAKAVAARDTWTRRCDRSFFMSSETNDSFPTIGLGQDTFSRKHLAAKARKSWLYLYEHHLNDCEFFLKADPDTYIVVENLKEYLTNFSHEDALYFGHRYRPRGWRFTYMAGGPGVILSRKAVRDLVEKAFYSSNHTLNHCMYDGSSEDWRIASCLSMVGTRAVDTRDERGRQRFMVFNLPNIFRGAFPKWYVDRDEDGNTKGLSCCSDYPIGFHYVGREEIYKMEYFWYRTKKKFDLGIRQEVPDKPETALGGY